MPLINVNTQTIVGSLNVNPAAEGPEETCRALDAIYQRRGRLDEKMALVRTLLDSGFDIDQVIDVNGREMRVLDLAIQHGDSVFAEWLVRDCRANPHLCMQDAWFLDGLKNIYYTLLPSATTIIPIGYPDGIYVEPVDVTEGDVVTGLPATVGEVTSVSEKSLDFGHSIVTGCMWAVFLSIGMAAIGAAGGYVGAAILRNYDLFEAAQMAGNGGVINGAVLGMVGPSVVHADMNGRDSDFSKGNTVFASIVVAGALNGLIGYEIKRYGNTETSMDVAQAVAVSFLGTLVVATVGKVLLNQLTSRIYAE